MVNFPIRILDCHKCPISLHSFYYSCTDWNGLCDILRDALWDDTFKLSASAAASEFCQWVKVGIDIYIYIYVYIYIDIYIYIYIYIYIHPIKSVRLRLTHLHGFQLLVLLL